jgi:hypothetical protein
VCPGIAGGPSAGRGLHSSAHGALPLRQPRIESLHDPLSRVPDPRAANREFHIGAALAIVSMALLSGQRDISQITRFGWRLTPAQRKSLGLPRQEDAKKRSPRRAARRGLRFFAEHRETYASLPAFVETLASRLALALRLIRSVK